MQFHRDIRPTAYSLRSYGVGQVTVSVPAAAAPGQLPGTPRILTRSFVIAPDRLIPDWPPQVLAELAAAHFEVIAAMEPEVVLLGSGAATHFPRSDFLSPLTSRGIGVEVMDTGAACRTYNILSADGRRVAAALLMIHADA
jgi:uncharacterized protein